MGKQGWIFGKSADLLVFSLPVIICALYSFIGQRLFNELIPPSIYFLPLLFLLDTPHILFTLFAASTSVPTESKNWLKFGSLALVLFFFGVYQTEYWYLAHIVIAHLAAWHFMKQQQAWFYIAQGRGDRITSIEKWIGKISINGVTWAPLLMSLCHKSAFGWYMPNDLIILPWAWHVYLKGVFLLSIVIYFLFYLFKAFKENKVNLAQHNVWLCAVIIWGSARAFGSPYSGIVFQIIPHSVPYLFLIYRYLNSQKKINNYKFLKQISAFKLCLGLYLVFVIYRISKEFVVLNWFSTTIDYGYLEPSAFYPVAIIFTALHFYIDMFYWNRKNNPGWTMALNASS
ncbi:MAG: hypothetical protein K2P81_14415 [Bacteriovoracaceae bacterium]|nr:hypothetical protein [Bacteriovoracaceae bacterium]